MAVVRTGEIRGARLAGSVTTGAVDFALTLANGVIEIEQRHQDAPITDTFAYLADLGYEGRYLAPGGLRPLAEFDVDSWVAGEVSVDEAAEGTVELVGQHPGW